MADNLLSRIYQFLRSRAFIALCLLLVIDAIFLGIHTESVLTHYISNKNFRIDTEGGYAERFQYMKWFFLFLISGHLAFRRKFVGYSAWSIIFLYLLCDDAFQIHEIGGFVFSKYISIHSEFGLRSQDIGELCTSTIFGTIFVGLVSRVYWVGDIQFRTICRDLFCLMVILAFFGIVLDMLHVVFGGINWKLNAIFAAVEDGGEMFVASMICSYLLWQAIQAKE